MKRLALFLGSGAVVLWSIGASLGGCSPEVPAADDAGGGSFAPSTSGTSGTSRNNDKDDGKGTSSGTSGTSGTPKTDSGPKEPGTSAKSNPKKITCAAKECDPENTKCCWPNNDPTKGVCAETCDD